MVKTQLVFICFLDLSSILVLKVKNTKINVALDYDLIFDMFTCSFKCE